MEEVILKAEQRQIRGKQVKTLRRSGKLPAIIYGHGFEPVVIELDQKESSHILSGVSSSHLINVDVAGAKHVVLVRERQRNPVTGFLIHVDFQEVSMTEKLKTKVRIYLEGESPAVKSINAVLVTRLEELEIECLPNDLPERVTINIEGLKNFGDSIMVRDLAIPPAVQVLTDPTEIVVLVTIPAAEEVVVAAPTEAVTGEPEVIERGKKEEEEGF